MIGLLVKAGKLCFFWPQNLRSGLTGYCLANPTGSGYCGKKLTAYSKTQVVG